MIAIALITAGVFWVVAGFLWVGRRDARSHASRFQGLVETSPDALEEGMFSALVGEASASEPLEDPVDGASVAYLELRLERLDALGRRASLLVSEETTLLKVAGVEVALESAQIDVLEEPPELAEEMPSALVRALLEDTRHAFPAPDETRPQRGTKWELRRRRIRLGETLTVIGVAGPGPDGGLRFRSELGPLVVSPRTVSELVRDELSAPAAMDRMVAVAGAFGAASLAVALWLLF